jgi:hypothetical protein
VPGVAIHQGRVYAVAGSHNQLDGGLYVWVLDPATGEALDRTVITGGMSNLSPFADRPPAVDQEGRTNDIPVVDRHGLALHVRDIAVDLQTMDWLNLCAFGDREFEGVGSFTRETFAKLTQRPLENHNAMYRPESLLYGVAGLGIKQHVHWLWREDGTLVSGKELALGPDRVLQFRGMFDRGNIYVTMLDKSGRPIKPDAEKSQPLIETWYQPMRAMAMTPNRIVTAHVAARISNRDVPAQLKLWDDSGKSLAVADLPSDPVPGGMAIAGKHIVVCTEDGAIHHLVACR